MLSDPISMTSGIAGAAFTLRNDTLVREEAGSSCELLAVGCEAVRRSEAARDVIEVGATRERAEPSAMSVLWDERDLCCTISSRKLGNEVSGEGSAKRLAMRCWPGVS